VGAIGASSRAYVRPRGVSRVGDVCCGSLEIRGSRRRGVGVVGTAVGEGVGVGVGDSLVVLANCLGLLGKFAECDFQVFRDSGCTDRLRGDAGVGTSALNVGDDVVSLVGDVGAGESERS
jgi:hypothetical protein